MGNIFYCKHCNETFSTENDTEGDKIKCPNCNGYYAFKTDMDKDTWRNMTKEEREAQKKKFAVQQDTKKGNKIGNLCINASTVYAVITAIAVIIVFLDSGFIPAFICLIGGLLGALLLTALGEIINLLQDIKDK